ncbi:LacI family DNA-binding transcriptional regulator [Novosphingobium sp. FSW06-99]|uniref:LacI family DNA-binding transcriptional regulator n=1 Tax=Novosphingobium sp. FSW06-99 TaxID=1739113 RepID=UPI0009E84188|nr:substrate-binding domain-containing protein [Novosphingobium sp. FSW06-99]
MTDNRDGHSDTIERTAGHSPDEIVAPRQRIRNITELARLAGVSPGTVSRALAGKSLVNPQTRDRIQTLAREHGFRLNQMASRLRTQRTGVIGVVFPLGHESRQHISDPFFMTLFGYLADELTESGHDIMLSRVIPGDTEWLDRIVDSGMLDGALVIGQSDQSAVIDAVASRYMPLVVWGTHHADQIHCTVGSNNRLGGRLAAERLLAIGKTRLAFLGETRGPEIADRLAGVRDAIAGRSDVVLRQVPTPLSSEALGEHVVAQLAELGDDLDGIVAASDVIAMMVLRALHERGARVPEQIAVVGFDDLPIATSTVPQLTTVRQDIAGGAKAMVGALMQRMAGINAPATILQPELVIRESA